MHKVQATARYDGAFNLDSLAAALAAAVRSHDPRASAARAGTPVAAPA